MEGTRRGLRGVPVPEHVEMGREFDKDRVKTLPPPMGGADCQKLGPSVEKEKCILATCTGRLNDCK